MITPTNDITRFFAQLGMKIKIHAPRKKTPRARHTIEFMPGGDLTLDRFNDLLIYYFGEDVRDGRQFDELTVHLADFNPEGHGITGICKQCGCTNGNACADQVTGTCWWVKEDLCSACALPDEINAAMEEMRALTDLGEGSGT